MLPRFVDQLHLKTIGATPSLFFIFKELYDYVSDEAGHADKAVASHLFFQSIQPLLLYHYVKPSHSLVCQSCVKDTHLFLSTKYFYDEFYEQDYYQDEHGGPEQAESLGWLTTRFKVIFHVFKVLAHIEYL